MNRSQKKKTSPKWADRAVDKKTLAEAAEFETLFGVGDRVKVDHKQKPWERVVEWVKSMVERKPKTRTKSQYGYGVVKWVGYSISDPDCFLAGVEMENVVEGGHSGKFEGKRYFRCKDGHGLILPLSCLQRDDRFGFSTSTEEDKEHTVSHHTQRPRAYPCVIYKPNMNIFRVGYTFGVSPQIELSALYVSLPRDVIASAIIGKVAINYEKEIRRKVLTWLSSSERWVSILADKHNREFTLLLLVHAIRLKGELPTTITQTIEIPNRRMSYDSQLAVECFTNTQITIEEKCLSDNKVLLDSDSMVICHITGPADQIDRAKEMIHMSMKGDEIANTEFTFRFRKFVGELVAEGYRFNGQSF